MISNADIVETIELTAKLLELHNEDEFKIKTFTNAAYNLDKYIGDLAQLDFPQLTQIQGVGKMMAGKILEIVSDELKDNKQFVMTAIQKDPSVFKFASQRLKEDKYVFLLACVDVNNFMLFLVV